MRVDVQTSSVNPERVEGRLSSRGASTGSAQTALTPPLRFAGYAAIFNCLDKGGDIIRPGAFGTLPEGQILPLLWQHDPRVQIGQITYAAEDRRGLRVIGEISPDTDAARMLQNGNVRGLSFGYRAIRSSGRNPRVLQELDVAEISLVTFPMQMAAGVHHMI